MKVRIMDIDIVVTWVDGSDPEWLKERARYCGTSAELSDVRFRDWGLMRYWFRGIEKCAPVCLLSGRRNQHPTQQ